jgi:uncharacterized membrane protein
MSAHTTARLEAISDGVFAIALTLLILDVKIADPRAITSSAALWRALGDLGPLLFAFLLSFTIIFITWVNHHETLKLIRASSGPFIYANGFILLTVVALPFPTALLGEFLLTDHAAPAVVVYNLVLVVQALAWILVTHTALRDGLAVDEPAAGVIRANHRNGYGALALYLTLAVLGFWLPLTVAVVTTVSWVIWLARSMQMRTS